MDHSDDPWRLPDGGGVLRIRRLEGIAPLDNQHGILAKKTVPAVLEDVLFGGEGYCYALLDAARVEGLPDLLDRSGLQHLCLFKGDARDELADVAPWLVRLERGNSFARNLFTRGKAHWHLWDAQAGIFLRSPARIEAVRAHLRHFTRLQDGSGAWYYFRFWEPAVASTYFATLEGRPELAHRWFLPRQGEPVDAIIAIRPDLDRAEVFARGRIAPAARTAHLLTQQDVELMARVRHEADCDGLAANLRRTFPAEITMPEPALRDFTRSAVDRLVGLGFRQRDTLFVMLAWELFFGPNFERTDPELARILHSDRDEAERFEALKDRLAEIG